MNQLASLIQQDRPLFSPVPGIYSTLPDAADQRYDRYAKMYDRMIGSRLYNRLMWGTHPAAYTQFAAQAVGTAGQLHLDAGCGSLVSTATVYANTKRVCVLTDISLGMLQQAQKRLLQHTHTQPDNIIFLQADVRDLPFRPDTFSTVGSFGMFHIFADVAAFAAELQTYLTETGTLYFSSLVAESARAQRMLMRLNKMGEVGGVWSAAQLAAQLPAATITTKGAMAYGRIDHASAFKKAD